MGLSFSEALCTFVDYALAHKLIEPADKLWAYNSILAWLGDATTPCPRTWLYPESPASYDSSLHTLDELLTALVDKAVSTGHAQDTTSGRDRCAMGIMGIITPQPSALIGTWNTLYQERGPQAATSWFYELCCNVGYVRRSAIAKNIAWTTATTWGDLEITINLSKPEKDPRDIAKAGARTSAVSYPACQLCIENEGYPGRAASEGGEHPARNNLRIIPLNLNGEQWGFQYSPYAYFQEHCIVMSARHRPMHIDAAAFKSLLDVVKQIPHYFVGSNADLPIVGGSILSHDHFQGGNHIFPMMNAQEALCMHFEKWPQVQASVLKWPMSVIRLRSDDSVQLLAIANHILAIWRNYSDPSVSIIALTEDGVDHEGKPTTTRHNTITPVFRSTSDGSIECYLALRCNITTPEHPLGLFHPHAQWHHIKKENIGLIEVMGLAILPPRLVPELEAVERILLSYRASTGKDLTQLLEQDPLAQSHAAWAHDLYMRRASEIEPDTIQQILRDEVGQVFANVLKDAGVFAWGETGRAALERFLIALGAHIATT